VFTTANNLDQEGPFDLLDEDRVPPGCVGEFSLGDQSTPLVALMPELAGTERILLP
jgi:hypothetical protein